MPSDGMNTCMSMLLEKGLGTFEHRRCSTDLLRCILLVLPKLMSGVSSVGINCMHIYIYIYI
jgi:hypothetical protein